MLALPRQSRPRIQDMKTLILIPVKNEEWILEHTLRNMAPFADHILVADQASTDSTREICAKFPNVTVIDNPNQGHSNRVRWLMLDEARRLFPAADHNLMICIDADEMIAPAGIEAMKMMVANGSAVPGDVFRLRWIQLWKKANQYMDEGAWKDSWKNIAFVDKPPHASDEPNEYRRDFVINDHTSRVPDTHMGNVIRIDHPLLHFHFVAWKKSQLKQAWYRCTELISGKRNAKRINNTYRVTLMPSDVRVQPVPPEWTAGLDIPQSLEDVSSSWHLEEIIGFFEKHGALFFEDLQIWHVPELHEAFVKKTGREPISKTYPAWLSALNEIRNTIRNGIMNRAHAFFPKNSSKNNPQSPYPPSKP
jgi:glycosyltransferase involved in cell wall biosynthesis